MNANAFVNGNLNELVDGTVNVNVLVMPHHVTSRHVLVTSRRVASHDARGRGEAPKRAQDTARAARARRLLSIKAAKTFKRSTQGRSVRTTRASNAPSLGPISAGDVSGLPSWRTPHSAAAL